MPKVGEKGEKKAGKGGKNSAGRDKGTFRKGRSNASRYGGSNEDKGSSDQESKSGGDKSENESDESENESDDQEGFDRDDFEDEGSIFGSSSTSTAQLLGRLGPSLGAWSSSDDDDEDDEEDYVTAAGFELQMLDSDVEVIPKPGDNSGGSDNDVVTFESADDGRYEALRASADDLSTRLGLTRYGTDWHVDQDGDNLEFVTEPFAADHEGTTAQRETMDEIEKVVGELSKGEPGSTYKLGDTLIRLNTRVDLSGRTQPQVTIDVTLDKLSEAVQLFASDHDMQERLFGATGAFGWTPDKTRAELNEVSALASGLQGLSDKAITSALKTKKGLAGAPTNADTLRGMLLLIGQAVIHKSEYKSALDKDQPILHKTDMARTWDALVDAGLVGEVTIRSVIALLERAYPGLAKNPSILKEMVQSIVGKGVDPVWASQKEPVSVKTNRKKIAIELRRNPIMTASEWSSFVDDASSDLMLADFHYELPAPPSTASSSTASSSTASSSTATTRTEPW